METNELKELTAKARTGDRSAFEELYNEYMSKVYSFAKRNVGDIDAARDITSETFTAALEGICSLRDEESFAGWLYSIAYKKCADYHRLASHGEPLSDDLPDTSLNSAVMLPDDHAVSTETKQKLGEIVNSLSRDQRSAVILYYYEGMSIPEVARALGTNENNTRQKLFKARRQIRKGIEKVFGKGPLLAAVPMEALLRNTEEAGCVPTSVTTATVSGFAAGLRIAAVGLFAAATVAVPIALHNLDDSKGDYRPDDSDLIISESEDSSPETNKTLELIDVDIKGYDGLSLTFEHNGVTHTVPFARKDFYNDGTTLGIYKSLSEAVIDNKLGEPVKGRLKAASDFSVIKYCDILSVNGHRYDMEGEFLPGTNTPDERYDYTLRRIRGSICEISNPKHSFTVDVSDLPMYMKEIYKDEMTPVQFFGYTFKSGNFMIYHLSVNATVDSNGSRIFTTGGNEDYVTQNCLGFVGTVQKVDEERAEVLLNDNKTVCNVPLYFRDGSIKTGDSAVIMINADPTRWDSGEYRNYDFALVYTDMNNLDLQDYDLSKIKYVIPENIYAVKLKIVTTDGSEIKEENEVKKITMLTAAAMALVITGCTDVPDDVRSRTENSRVGEVFADAKLEQVSVNALQTDAEAALKGNYSQFRLRDGITVNIPSELYRCSFKQADDFDARYKEIFSKIFDEELLSKVDIREEETLENPGEKVTKQYYYKSVGFRSDELKEHCFLHNSGFLCFIRPSFFDDPGNCGKTIRLYYADRGEDLSDRYDLDGGSVSIQEAVDLVQKWVDEKYAYLEPQYTFKVKDVSVHQNDYGEDTFVVEVEKSYKGVHLDSAVNQLKSYKVTDDGVVSGMAFVTNSLNFYIRKPGEIGFFTNGSGILIPTETKKLDKVISLSSILPYLTKTFAEFSEPMEISEISLKYTLSPDYDYENLQYYFHPGTKVNSRLVWEILIDVPVENLPASHKDQNRMVKYIHIDAETGELIYNFDTGSL